MEMSCAICWSSLTAMEAVLLAEQALKLGKLKAATCYINLAYAIYDASQRSGVAVTPRFQDRP